MSSKKIQIPYIDYKQKLYQETKISYLRLQKELTNFIEFCQIALLEKYSYDDFIEKASQYVLKEDIKWYIFADACVNYLLSNDITIIEFFEWFRQFEHTNAEWFYKKILNEKLQNKSLLKKYQAKLGVDIVAEYANSTSLDFVSEYEKRGFEDFLLKQYSNKDILSIFDNRARMHYSYMPTGFLYFVLSPIIEIDTSSVVKILSKINNIFLIESFFSIKDISYNFDVICKMFSLFKKITNENNEWNNKQYFLPLLALTFKEYLISLYHSQENLDDTDIDNSLIELIEIFIEKIKERSDCFFFVRKWLLHLVKNIDRGSDETKKVTELIIQAIGRIIVNQDANFSKEFFMQEKDGNKNKELLLALIYTTETMKFPSEILELFKTYILNLKNQILIWGENSYIKTEHYLFAQLFVELENSSAEWKNLWHKLYLERKKAAYSHYEDTMRNISHSEYLILIGMAVVEYFISDKKYSIADSFFNNLWNALIELYLEFRYYINEDFISTMIVRYMILKNILGLDVLPELKMFENNPELISNIILNLSNNAANLNFLNNERKILESMNIEITKRKMADINLKHTNKDYYERLEEIYNNYNK